MKNDTSWEKDTEKKEYPSLTTDMEVDVAIIGAGITGVLTAYLLAREGKKVSIIEKNRIGEEVTHLTTVFLTQILDTNLSDLISIYGEEKAKKIINSHTNAIDLIELIIKEEKIDSYFIRNQTKFNPMRFMTDLMEKTLELGVGIFEQTEASEIIESPSPSIKTKNGNRIITKWIIAATYEKSILSAARSIFQKKQLHFI